MTGLLIKDWKLLKNQGRYFVSVLAVFGALMLLGSLEYATFATSYFTFLLGYLTLSTISYDEYEGGMGFLMALPVNRRIYVMEKYVLAVLLTVVGWIACVALNAVYFGFRVERVELLEMLSEEPLYLMIVLVFVSFSLPLFLKFGPEKGRIVSIGIIGGCMLVMVSMMKLGIHMPGADSLGGALELLKMLENPFVSLAVCAGISIFAMGISFLISMAIMERREF